MSKKKNEISLVFAVIIGAAAFLLLGKKRSTTQEPEDVEVIEIDPKNTDTTKRTDKAVIRKKSKVQ